GGAVGGGEDAVDAEAEVAAAGAGVAAAAHVEAAAAAAAAEAAAAAAAAEAAAARAEALAARAGRALGEGLRRRRQHPGQQRQPRRRGDQPSEDVHRHVITLPEPAVYVSRYVDHLIVDFAPRNCNDNSTTAPPARQVQPRQAAEGSRLAPGGITDARA